MQVEETVASRRQSTLEKLRQALAKLENEKSAHKKCLRPQMADQNASAELQALREKESARVQKAMDLMEESKVSLKPKA